MEEGLATSLLEARHGEPPMVFILCYVATAGVYLEWAIS